MCRVLDSAAALRPRECAGVAPFLGDAGEEGDVCTIDAGVTAEPKFTTIASPLDTTDSRHAVYSALLRLEDGVHLKIASSFPIDLASVAKPFLIPRLI